jgi:hypothetical protein
MDGAGGRDFVWVIGRISFGRTRIADIEEDGQNGMPVDSRECISVPRRVVEPGKDGYGHQQLSGAAARLGRGSPSAPSAARGLLRPRAATTGSPTEQHNT